MLNKSLLTCLGLLALIFGYLARAYSHSYALTPLAALCIYLSFFLLLALVLIPGFSRKNLFAERRFSVLLIPLACSPYLIYAFGTGDFRWLACLKLLAVASSAWALYCLPLPRLQFFTWQDAIFAVLLLVFALAGQLKGIWNVPRNLDFMSRLFLVAVAAWSWVYLRPVPGLGYNFRIDRKILRAAALNFACYAAIAIPLSLALHFTAWHPRWPGLMPFCLDYLEIFLFVALLEELFFRCFLQTLLSNTFGSWVAGQIVVSCLFGLFHILHAPFPNWRYVALATIAGWFYGSAFRQGGNLMASALVHAAVDTIWRTWLSAR